ncbi:MAG: hypothetical protein HC771_23470 [Synechococcales cyanobacterium CRU_2_2]|nr:hypothetical protein [Synechococcales cyanobacterium CRU_2_2]
MNLKLLTSSQIILALALVSCGPPRPYQPDYMVNAAVVCDYDYRTPTLADDCDRLTGYYYHPGVYGLYWRPIGSPAVIVYNNYRLYGSSYSPGGSIRLNEPIATTATGQPVRDKRGKCAPAPRVATTTKRPFPQPQNRPVATRPPSPSPPSPSPPAILRALNLIALNLIALNQVPCHRVRPSPALPKPPRRGSPALRFGRATVSHLANLPVHPVPLQAVTLRAVPLRAVTLRAVTLRAVPLRAVPPPAAGRSIRLLANLVAAASARLRVREVSHGR